MSVESRQEKNAPIVIIDAIDAIDVDGERALWAEVLYQAVHDATRTGTRSYSSQAGVTPAEQEDARAFLADPTRLGPVCELLGINPQWFQAQVKKQYPWVFAPLEMSQPAHESWALQWEVLWLSISP